MCVCVCVCARGGGGGGGGYRFGLNLKMLPVMHARQSQYRICSYIKTNVLFFSLHYLTLNSVVATYWRNEYLSKSTVLTDKSFKY